eukprot:TRINITY_DN15658_c0_g1_i1.p1 TRINITY_DN15658_c0_g1~~TRINITY_DN15658_c0_g1_i1.p1  ORF type:complete len:448 (+),score=98.53 TRINITY_DN15658_c0_g1_i1:45-1346(+)
MLTKAAPFAGVGAAAFAVYQARRWNTTSSTEWDNRIVPATVGECLNDVDTPALCVDLNGIDENKFRLEVLVKQSGRMVTARPIVKAHKCSEIAKYQLASDVTKGVCCAKVCEAEAVLTAGITDIFISNEIIGRKKTIRLTKAMKSANITKIRIAVDSIEGADQLEHAAQSDGVHFDVIIEVSCGQNRCGVSSPEEAVTIAHHIRQNCAKLNIIGIQAYQGAAQHIRSKQDMKDEIANVVRIASRTKDALQKAGFEITVVTGAGSGTLDHELNSGVFTELQPGSYLFNDVDYSKNLSEAGTEEGESKWKASMFILTTVMSRTSRPDGSGWVVVDAGLKSHSIDSGMPALYGDATVTCVNGGDEHFKLLYPSSLDMPSIGEKVLLQPGHVDPTFNMHDHVVAFRSTRLPESSKDIMKDNPTVSHVWRVDARGAGL